MQVEWYGQSAFRLTADGATVFIDPFGDMSALASSRGLQFEYPAIDGVEADLVLVTHEHPDHNGVDAIGGDPTVLRSTAGRLQSRSARWWRWRPKMTRRRAPSAARTRSSCSGSTPAIWDFGQSELLEEQVEAIGAIDLLFIPVGGGPTIGAELAAAICEQLGPRWVVPMHYRTPRISFLETADDFLARMPGVERLDSPRFETSELPPDRTPLTVVPAAP
jgi:L-ascorbate metabolism protein UlaG (beta-lactamase superfamily)